MLVPPVRRFPPTPPITPEFPASWRSGPQSRSKSKSTSDISPEILALPPPLGEMPDFELPDAAMSFGRGADEPRPRCIPERSTDLNHAWRRGMTAEEKDARADWISERRGRPGLRIVIVTENFLPKVDGVTRTLARLLEHLEREGHHCMLLGPGTGMSHYASHPLVGTAGVPLVVYPGLKLNFLRPKFMRSIRDFQPDVVHFVDPIWLGAQTLMAMELGWAGEEWVGEQGPALGAGITGAVVASYHTNLATYAKLFGWTWLEPIMWRFQRWLYSKTLLTLCPSPSTLHQLEEQSFRGVRLWPRGVDVSQYSPSKRSSGLRDIWGVHHAVPSREPEVFTGAITQHLPLSAPTHEIIKLGKTENFIGYNFQGRKASLPLTPPESPAIMPVDMTSVTAGIPRTASPSTGDERCVLLYIGRISWEKNLHLLLSAFANLPALLAPGASLPKLVFVGDGPARLELETICRERGFDATFMGHRGGEELAMCYASADIFAFPSFTETFGQVVLEALASGLPVIGLDADGTRDLVSPERTGLLYTLPSHLSWPNVSRRPESEEFQGAAKGYAQLLARLVVDRHLRTAMGETASREGVNGFTWWDAMERCVDGYRESIRMAKQQREAKRVEMQAHLVPPSVPPVPTSPRMSRVNRALSSPLAHRGKWPPTAEGAAQNGPTREVKSALGRRMMRASKVRGSDTVEGPWHLKTVLKALVAIWLFYAIYSHHSASKAVAGSVGGDWSLSQETTCRIVA